MGLTIKEFMARGLWKVEFQLGRALPYRMTDATGAEYWIYANGRHERAAQGGK